MGFLTFPGCLATARLRLSDELGALEKSLWGGRDERWRMVICVIVRVGESAHFFLLEAPPF